MPITSVRRRQYLNTSARRHVLALSVLLLLSAGLHAQTKYLNGYYIDQKGDTIRGWIAWLPGANYTRCKYKESPTAKVKKFTADQIRGYVVDDKAYYISRKLADDENEEELLPDAQTGTRVFFKVVLRGKTLTLLRHDTKYFALDNTSTLYEITKTQINRSSGAKDGIHSFGLLKALMKDCPSISAFLEQQFKTNPDYLAIFEKYNDCIGAPHQRLPDPVVKVHTELGLQISAVSGQMSFRSYTRMANSGRTVSPGGGIYVSIFLPGLNDYTRLMIEANYHQTKQDFAYQRTVLYGSAKSNNHVVSDVAFVGIPIHLRHYIGRVFLDWGGLFQHIAKQNTNWSEEIVFTNDGSSHLTNSKVTFPGHSFGFLAGAGVRFGPLQASLRYTANVHGQFKDLGMGFQNIEFMILGRLLK